MTAQTMGMEIQNMPFNEEARSKATVTYKCELQI